jgi:hypothetical protein
LVTNTALTAEMGLRIHRRLSACAAERRWPRPNLIVPAPARGRQLRIVGLMSIQEASSTAFLPLKNGLTVEQANGVAYHTVQLSKIDAANADARDVAIRFENVRYLDKYAVFYDDAAKSTLLHDSEGHMLFADNFHLTTFGGRYFGRQIAALKWFDSP